MSVDEVAGAKSQHKRWILNPLNDLNSSDIWEQLQRTKILFRKKLRAD
jgi:hypothetical protein